MPAGEPHVWEAGGLQHYRAIVLRAASPSTFRKIKTEMGPGGYALLLKSAFYRSCCPGDKFVSSGSIKNPPPV